MYVNGNYILAHHIVRLGIRSAFDSLSLLKLVVITINRNLFNWSPLLY